MKVCTSCNLELPKTDFYPRGKYISAKCKLCTCNGQKSKRKSEHIPSTNEILVLEGKRQCSCCGSIKDSNEFYKKRKSFESWCKVCKAEKKKEYFENNPEAKLAHAQQSKDYRQRPDVKVSRKEYSANYYQVNKEYHDKWVKNWHARNPEKNYEYCNRWRLSNLDISAYLANKRYACNIIATPSWAKDESHLIRAVYTQSKQLQEQTNIKYHVDHIVPLNSDLVCGLNCAANLRAITAFENMSKGNRYWPDMWEPIN